MEPTKVVAARLPEALHERVRVAAFWERTSRSTLVAKAIQEYLQTHHPEKAKKKDKP